MDRPPSQLLQQRRQTARQIGQDVTLYLPDAAVLVFGSVASGHVDAHSDIDLFVIGEQVPTLDQRRGLTDRLGGDWQFGVADSNPLFPLMDESQDVQGVPVTLHYQRAAWVEEVLEQVVADGAITTELLPFRPYTLAGLVQRAWVLEDGASFIAYWQERLAVFPSALRNNLLAHFTPLLEEQVAELVANAERRLGPRVVLFNLNWAVDALIGVLYAINETYDPADRRAERTVWPYLRRAPKDFSLRLTEILNGPFDDDTAVEKSRLFEVLALEVLAEAESLDIV